MMDNTTSVVLKPFDFHIKLKDFLVTREKLWDWFSKDKAKKEHFEKFKNELLKDSYRMDSTSHPELYEMISDIKKKANIPIKITLYQEQLSYYNNVGISFDEKEAHIIISGRVLKILDKDELKAVFSHELYHYFLFAIDDKSYEIADRIITSIANDNNSPDTYLESARLFKLYTELYCDRGAFTVMNDIKPMISALVKLSTGADKVNVDAYLDQADEILDIENQSTKQSSHPDTYIRAKSLSLWSIDGHESDEKIRHFIEPQLDFEKLNVFSQKKLSVLTKELIGIIIRPSWNKTERTINQAKSYFPNISQNMAIEAESLFDKIRNTTDSTKKYLAYVLLDFSLVDPNQGNTCIGYAFELAENAGMKEQFNHVVKKEVKLTVRKLKDLQEDAAKSLNQINESKEDSLYGE